MTLRDGSKLFKPQFCPACGGRVFPAETDHYCEKCHAILPYGKAEEVCGGLLITVQVLTDKSKIEEMK